MRISDWSSDVCSSDLTADSAVVTFRAEGRLDEGIACKVDTGRALVEAGLHPAAGGTGTQACSGDMLLEALAACTGVTLNAVATAIDFKLAGGRVIVDRKSTRLNSSH